MLLGVVVIVSSWLRCVGRGGVLVLAIADLNITKNTLSAWDFGFTITNAESEFYSASKESFDSTYTMSCSENYRKG